MFYETLCPSCNQKAIIEVTPIILAGTKESSRIFDGDLYSHKCHLCHSEIFEPYPITYVDIINSIIIVCSSDDWSRKKLEKDLMLNIGFIRTIRMVESIEDLREKIRIFDYKLNDKAIELMKQDLCKNTDMGLGVNKFEFYELDGSSFVFRTTRTRTNNTFRVPGQEYINKLMVYNVFNDKSTEFVIDANWAKAHKA